MVNDFKTDWYWSGKMSQRVKALADLSSLLGTHAMEVPTTHAQKLSSDIFMWALKHIY